MGRIRGHANCVEQLIAEGANVKVLSAKHQKRYAYIIQPRKQQTYTAVNNHIVVKHEGKISGIGALRKIFDFHSKTVTEVINETPGPAKEFMAFRQNKEEILAAHNWLKKQGEKPPHPFETKIRTINKRPPNSK